jgi:hypothetical protein
VPAPIVPVWATASVVTAKSPNSILIGSLPI